MGFGELRGAGGVADDEIGGVFGDGGLFFRAEGYELGGDVVAGAHGEGAGDDEVDTGEGAGGALEGLGVDA